MLEEYKIHNIDAVDTPSLVIYPQRVKKNIETLKTFIDDMSRVRPHIKTNKCPKVVRLMLEAGIHKFKCATIAEAEMLAMEGAQDVLLAYQPTGPKLKRFLALQRQFSDTTFACLVDHPAVLQEFISSAKDNGEKIRVYIDLNVGMNRTGITPGSQAMKLFREAHAAEGIEFLGLHAYDGHLRDPDLSVRTKLCNDAFAPVEEMRREVARISGKDPVIVAGGTPTFPIHAKRPDVETSPGTFIFWDRGYQQLLSEQPFQFAALVVTRVISIPDEYTLCLDLGHKSIAAENDITKRVHLLNATELQPVGQSEEHLVLRSAEKHGYSPGHVFYGVPYHVCPTVALYDEAWVCVDGNVNGTWPILARKRKIAL